MGTTPNELPDMSTPPVPPEYAFPVVLETHNNGLTVRDYFAARIMAAQLSMPETYPIIARDGEAAQMRIARAAYGWADLMMEARKLTV